MAKKTGRPTVFNEAILQATEKYIEECEDSGKNVELPTIEGLAYHLRLHKDTIYDWRKKHPQFSDLIEDLLAKQAKRLVNKGLSGAYNPTIAKVLLTKHGYREGHEHTGPEGQPLFDEEAKAKSKAAVGAILGGGDTGQGK